MKKLLKMKTTPDAISVMEWTGPGLFTGQFKLVRSSVLSRCHSRILSGPQTPSWRSSFCLFSQSALSSTDRCPSTRSYLYHQFDGFSWRDLRFRKRPLRIGEVLILPVTGFSPVGDRDVDAEGVDSPQACVVSFESLCRRA